MQTGIITPDNLSQVLRSISQRRRNGVFTVTAGEDQVIVYFNQGRIVEATGAELYPVEELVEVLRTAGLVGKDFYSDDSSYSEFFLKFHEEYPDTPLDESLFKQVIRHRILNKLYSINPKSAGAFYEFSAQMIDYDKNFSPSISVGQLLLDLVALESDSEKFYNQFPEGCVLVPAREPEVSLSDEEILLLAAIGQGAVLEDVAQRSMLSVYHFHDGLLSLINQELITVQGNGDVSHAVQSENGQLSGAQQVDSGNMQQFFSESIEKAFKGNAEKPAGDPDPQVLSTKIEQYDMSSEYTVLTGMALRFRILNAKFLHMSWLPNAMIGLLIFCATVLPLVCWGKVFGLFEQ